jgi:hypothetical protein
MVRSKQVAKKSAIAMTLQGEAKTLYTETARNLPIQKGYDSSKVISKFIFMSWGNQLINRNRCFNFGWKIEKLFTASVIAFAEIRGGIFCRTF